MTMKRPEPHKLPLDALLDTSAWHLPGQAQHARGILAGLYEPLLHTIMGVIYALFVSVIYFFALTIVLIVLNQATESGPETTHPLTVSIWLPLGALVCLSSPIWIVRRLSERTSHPGRHAGRRLLVELLARLSTLANPDKPVVFDNLSLTDDNTDMASWHMTLPTTRGPQPAIVCSAETTPESLNITAHWQGQDHQPLLSATWRRHQGRWSDDEGRHTDDPVLNVAHDMALALKLEQVSTTPGAHAIQISRGARPALPPTSSLSNSLKLPVVQSGVTLRQPSSRPPWPSLGDVLYSLGTGAILAMALWGLVEMVDHHGWDILKTPNDANDIMMLAIMATCILYVSLQERFPDGIQVLPLRATPVATRHAQEHIEFDGRHLINDAQRVDLDEPFTLNLTQRPSRHAPTSDSPSPIRTWLTVELVQRLGDQPAKRLRFQCPSTLDEDLPTLDVHAAHISADAFYEELWPILLTRLDAHGQRPRFDLTLTTEEPLGSSAAFIST